MQLFHRRFRHGGRAADEKESLVTFCSTSSSQLFQADQETSAGPGPHRCTTADKRSPAHTSHTWTPAAPLMFHLPASESRPLRNPRGVHLEQAGSSLVFWPWLRSFTPTNPLQLCCLIPHFHIRYGCKQQDGSFCSPTLPFNIIISLWSWVLSSRTLQEP